MKTNDEIGDLATSINIMSEKLQEAHQDLTDRNEHLKRFMGDVTHELKLNRVSESIFYGNKRWSR